MLSFSKETETNQMKIMELKSTEKSVQNVLSRLSNRRKTPEAGTSDWKDRPAEHVQSEQRRNSPRDP